MLSTTTIYLLFIITKGDLPALTAIGTYQDSDSCRAAATQITETLKGGGFRDAVVCISQESLEALAKANDLEGQTSSVAADE
jgi:hypothetical protein